MWIYGGAYDFGGISDPLYNGCNLATDAVVVSIAYRVGALGFLYLPSAGIAGNFGVQDILLGLQWVQDNIVAFGGDPVSRQFPSACAQANELLCNTEIGTCFRPISWCRPDVVNQYFTTSPIIDLCCHRGVWCRPQSSDTCSIPSIWAQLCQSSWLQQYRCKHIKSHVKDILVTYHPQINCFRTKSVAQINASSPITPATTETSPNKWQQFLDGTIIPVDPPSTGSKVPFLAGSSTTRLSISLNPANNHHRYPRRHTLCLGAVSVPAHKPHFRRLPHLSRSKFPISSFRRSASLQPIKVQLYLFPSPICHRHSHDTSPLSLSHPPRPAGYSCRWSSCLDIPRLSHAYLFVGAVHPSGSVATARPNTHFRNPLRVPPAVQTPAPEWELLSHSSRGADQQRPLFSMDVHGRYRKSRPRNRHCRRTMANI